MVKGGGWGGCLQGVEGDCGAHGDDVDDDADGGSEQDGVDGDAKSRVHFREGVWEGVAAIACEGPGMDVLVRKVDEFDFRVERAQRTKSDGRRRRGC